MKAERLVFACVALVGMPSARAQEGAGSIEAELARPAAAPTAQAAQPVSMAPTEEPPPPPAEPPPLKVKGKKKSTKAAVEAQVAASSEADDQVVYSLGSVTVAIPTPSQEPTRIGQWVYTAQYGWLYMPYGPQYVTESTGDDAGAYEYAYHPGDGWSWLNAPWISGSGPYPYYGAVGAGSYVWSSQAYGRYYSVGLRPSPYDLNYNYYGKPLASPSPWLPSSGRVGRSSGVAARTPALSTPATYPGFRTGLQSSPSPRGGGASPFAGSASFFHGMRSGSSNLGGGPTLGGSRSGSSSLGGGSVLGGGHRGSSTLGSSSVLRGSGSSLSGGSSMGSRGGGSFSGHHSGAAVGHRR